MTPNEVKDFFNAHWTVRKYKKFVMPADHLDAILTAAQRAPTDATAQMFTFVRLTDSSLRDEIAKLSNNAHIATASEAFIICADIHRLEEILKAHSYTMGKFKNIAIHFAIGDAVLAGQNMLVAAEMLGYRGCWIGGVINSINEISAAIQLPKGVFPFAGLTIGVPDEPPLHRPRIARELVIHENTYRNYSQDELKTAVVQMASINPRGDWAGALNAYFGKDGSMVKRDGLLNDFLAKIF